MYAHVICFDSLTTTPLFVDWNIWLTYLIPCYILSLYMYIYYVIDKLMRVLYNNFKKYFTQLQLLIIKDSHTTIHLWFGFSIKKTKVNSFTKLVENVFLHLPAREIFKPCGCWSRSCFSFLRHSSGCNIRVCGTTSVLSGCITLSFQVFPHATSTGSTFCCT